MFTHTDQKDFKCELCETAFRTKGSLIRHNRRHTGKTKRACVGLYWVVKVVFMQVFHSILTSFPLADERPYRCSQCGLAFRESGALTRHLKSLTPCTEKIRYSQCKEILVSKDGVRKGNSHLMTSVIGGCHLTIATSLKSLKREVAMFIPFSVLDD